MRRLKAVTAMALGLTVPIAVSPAQTVHVVGMGIQSCGAWAANRRARSAPLLEEQWVVGYLSGVARWSGILNPMDRQLLSGTSSGQDRRCR